MSRTVERRSSHPPAATDTADVVPGEDVQNYIADMLDELRHLAKCSKRQTLSVLLDMAYEETRRNALTQRPTGGDSAT